MGRAWYHIRKLSPAAVPGRVLSGLGAGCLHGWELADKQHKVAQAGIGENKAKPFPGTGLWSRDHGENPPSGAGTHPGLSSGHMGVPVAGRGRELGVWSAGMHSMARQPPQECQGDTWEYSVQL